MLDGGKLIRYGAKAIPEGGLFAMPRPYGDGLLLIGDTAGFLNGMRLKGIHLAMKSGMMAAETVWDALQAGAFDAGTLSAFERRFKDRGRIRNALVAQLPPRFQARLVAGLINAGLATFTGGRGVRLHRQAAVRARLRDDGEGRIPAARDAARGDRQRSDVRQAYRRLQLRHDARRESAEPSEGRRYEHLSRPLHGRVRQSMPVFLSGRRVRADVRKDGDGSVDGRLQINFTNCVHCKTCDIIDPYQIITWVPPQGGEGPVYTGM